MTRHLSCLFVLLAAAGAALAVTPEPKTVITGDQMEILRGGQAVVFTGNSKVKRGESELSADTLVQDKKNGVVEASGNIRFKGMSQDREPIHGSADKAVYRPREGQGRLFEGRPTIVYEVKNASAPLSVRADSIDFDQKKEEITAQGAVEIITSSGSAYAPQALLRQREKKVVLSGPSPQPMVVYNREGKTSTYAADTITYDLDRKRLLLQGSVRGILRGKELEGK